MTTTETATITRISPFTGRTVTKTVYIVREWDSYIGIEPGRPVIVTYSPGGPEQYEVLSPRETTTITTI